MNLPGTLTWHLCKVDANLNPRTSLVLDFRTEPGLLAEKNLNRSTESYYSSICAEVMVKAELDEYWRSAPIEMGDTRKAAAITADSHGSGHDYDLCVQFLGEPLINGDICTKESCYPNCGKQNEHLKAIRFREELKLLDF